MKIFMVHEDPWHAGNPYIYTLIEGIKRSHPDCEIGWGRELFWSDDIYSFDIVHFHWPQTFMGKDSHSEADLLRHIEKMKSAVLIYMQTAGLKKAKAGTFNLSIGTKPKGSPILFPFQ